MSSRMGHQSVKWAYGLELPGATPAMRSVLVAVAHTKNEATGQCFPGQALLAEMTSQSRATVGRALAALESLGVISRSRRKKSGQYRTSDNFTLNTSYAAQSHVAESHMAESHVAGRTKSSSTVSILMPHSDGVIEIEEKGKKEREDARPGNLLFGKLAVGDEPLPFCSKHQPFGSDGEPCGACRDARQVRDMWLREQKNAPTPTPARRAEMANRMCSEPGHQDYPLPCEGCKRAAARERSVAL